MKHPYLVLGDHNAICDRCGQKYKASSLRKTWDGLWVCQKDWEPRHPQELIRAIKDDPSVPWSRPEAQDQFIQVITIFSRSAVAGLAVAGLAISGKDQYMP